MYSGFARHKDPKLDAAGALTDLLMFSLNLTGLDILGEDRQSRQQPVTELHIHDGLVMA